MAASNQEWKACKNKYHEAERRLFALVGLALNEVDSFSGFISPFTVDCLFRFWEAGHTRWHLHLCTWQTAITNNAHDTRTKIGAKIRTRKSVPKTGTKIEHCPICYGKPVPGKFSTKLHVRCARNQYQLSTGTGFRVQISDTCVMGITTENS